MSLILQNIEGLLDPSEWNDFISNTRFIINHFLRRVLHHIWGNRHGDKIIKNQNTRSTIRKVNPLKTWVVKTGLCRNKNVFAKRPLT